MTRAPSTAGGGGGAAARTLPSPQPKAFSRSTTLAKALDICFIIFPLNRVTEFPLQSRHSRDCAFQFTSSFFAEKVSCPTELLGQLHVHEMQIACQNRTRLSNAESRNLLALQYGIIDKCQKCQMYLLGLRYSNRDRNLPASVTLSRYVGSAPALEFFPLRTGSSGFSSAPTSEPGICILLSFSRT